MVKPRVLISTIPFGERDSRPIELLADAGLDAVINPLGRKLQPGEIDEMIEGFDALVAGTEQITAETLDKATDLKVIARVGIGLDSVDLLAARERNVAVAYTPDGPSAAVGEITVGLMVNLLRGVTAADRAMRAGTWQRIMGRRIAKSTVGIIGVGRIGKLLIEHLQGGFPGVRILANDLEPDTAFGDAHAVIWADKETIYREADVVSLHLPLTPLTRGLVGTTEMKLMKPTASLINTARGGIINEENLANALRDGLIATAAIDVFESEPYTGDLTRLENCLLTSHMGSMSEDCRARMETEAVEEIVRFFSRQPFANPIPEEEYDLAREMMGKG
ncbi:MAG: phosphoglycerate dehydrogenase [Rhodospirillales bacterium]|nr:phosphoglycerate dehydrogenase [Rhodospirillales bacterium]